MTEVALAILIVSFAMFVRGFTGFGGALLTVPLLSLIWDVQQAIVVVAAMQLVTGATLAVISRDSIARPELTRVLIPSFVGLAAGAVLLSSLPLLWVTRSLGVFSVAAGMHMLVQARRRSSSARRELLKLVGPVSSRGCCRVWSGPAGR
ncbi:MAG: sulfite exporter TauE/SafE family protein [Thermomicrobiales bacterium]